MSPIYIKLKDALVRDIAQQIYQPGDMLPSETELIKSWSVSRITVRNAIKELVREGFAYTLHGRGTFVAEQKITNLLPTLTSLSHDIAAQGKKPGSKVLLLETVSADKNIASKLHIPPGNPVIHFIRTTLADNEPIAIAYTYLSISAIVPHQDEITKVNLENHSFYELLEKIGVSLQGGIQTISASGADPDQAMILAVKEGTPLIDSQRVAYTHEHLYVEFTKMLARPDFIQWKTSLGSV
jgi:GntR family transcriptional regulator